MLGPPRDTHTSTVLSCGAEGPRSSPGEGHNHRPPRVYWESTGRQQTSGLQQNLCSHVEPPETLSLTAGTPHSATAVLSQVVLCFSPVGSTLRVRARRFPAVVNCTAIDWFHEWPEDALVSVSSRFLEETPDIEVSWGPRAAAVLGHWGPQAALGNELHLCC